MVQKHGTRTSNMHTLVIYCNCFIFSFNHYLNELGLYVLVFVHFQLVSGLSAESIICSCCATQSSGYTVVTCSRYLKGAELVMGNFLHEGTFVVTIYFLVLLYSTFCLSTRYQNKQYTYCRQHTGCVAVSVKKITWLNYHKNEAIWWK